MSTVSIPVEVVNALIIMVNKVRKDIESIASNNELLDPNSKHYSLNFANNIVALSLLSTIDKQSGLGNIASDILNKLDIEQTSRELVT